jgi:hypothetical protein
LNGQAEDLDELILILRKTTAQPVTLIDPRAHLDAQLMKALAATHFFDIASTQNIGITLMVFPLDDLDVMTNLAAVCQFCGRQVDYVIVRNPARAPKNRMFDNSPMEKELLDCGAVTITVPVLSEFVKLRLAKLEADHQRGIPFNEAIGNDSLGLDIMARGVLQDWLATLFNQYDQIAAKLLPAVEAATIKPKIVPPIGEARVGIFVCQLLGSRRWDIERPCFQDRRFPTVAIDVSRSSGIFVQSVFAILAIRSRFVTKIRFISSYSA